MVEPPAVREGWRDAVIAEELPDLRLLTVTIAVARSCVGASPPDVRERLAAFSDRFNGAKAIAVRREAVPAAYRSFFREIGLDPETRRTPIEAAVFARLFDGGFVSRNLLEDVLLLALVDTGIAVWAIDAAVAQGVLGVRLAKAGERLRGDEAAGRSLHGGELVVADSGGPLTLLSEPPPAGLRPRRATRSICLYALQVRGISTLAVEEALWFACSALQARR